MLNNSRAEFERWFKNHYHRGNQPSGKRRDYSLAKDNKGRYLWLRAAVAIREINSELPRVYRQLGEHGFPKIYLGEVSADGLDKLTWENIRMQIEKQINEV